MHKEKPVTLLGFGLEDFHELVLTKFLTLLAEDRAHFDLCFKDGSRFERHKDFFEKNCGRNPQALIFTDIMLFSS